MEVFIFYSPFFVPVLGFTLEKILFISLSLSVMGIRHAYIQAIPPRPSVLFLSVCSS